jgi:hypothetical protein
MNGDLHYTVFKYGLDIADEQVLQLPAGARILYVGQQPLQKAPLQLWAHIDKRASLVSRKIVMYGTGHPMPAEPGKFLGTVLTHGGTMVWHVYDCGEKAH